jgi:hypothetical protein
VQKLRDYLAFRFGAGLVSVFLFSSLEADNLCNLFRIAGHLCFRNSDEQFRRLRKAGI